MKKGQKGPLALVLKADTAGTLEAVSQCLHTLDPTGKKLKLIRGGIGAVNQSDVNLAVLGSGIVVGFFVHSQARILLYARERAVDIKLYDVIYELKNDLKILLDARFPTKSEPSESILGEGKIIARFKSTRKGIILGVEVTQGSLRQGQHYRVIGVYGTIYQGVIGSLHIEKNTVRQAHKGQQVGLQILNWRGGKLGDLVESFSCVS